MIEPGHIYKLPHLETDGHEILTFIRRSSDAVDYGNGEHPGTNTQEVIRALIDRSEFLYNIIPNDETLDAIYHLRMALYCYEARAWRRKQTKLNKKAGRHSADIRHHGANQDVPFTKSNAGQPVRTVT